jgi:hypothetical protein
MHSESLAGELLLVPGYRQGLSGPRRVQKIAGDAASQQDAAWGMHTNVCQWAHVAVWGSVTLASKLLLLAPGAW